ncbi:hypothetical protein PC116_g20948 [Phytophthora cactorum]|uniref:Uncharacterized protein n=1 Tax=Phytophthora cactorum TaxID=29920 RepID=A0A8T1BP68_9STRA|nr:hypothetical protein Pcac1_g12978 [Phytophthora cactorum]KAG2879832.1 hypothetical protein PC114_g22366 [Phytophthora cactorum]KAG2906535.1 hypothetical protein PC117_g20481 [Phytophthora cactorum]KAG2978027.1 hypothetical protein PC119_g21857 [Phytophthora cactorum]KAG3143500.1 hypothetical protein C6341_g19041 [Phytophthora cactorum]
MRSVFLGLLRRQQGQAFAESNVLTTKGPRTRPSCSTPSKDASSVDLLPVRAVVVTLGGFTSKNSGD